MISWFSMILLFVAVLLVILVVRVSELSTRVNTLESYMCDMQSQVSELCDKYTHTVTHRELQTCLRMNKEL